MNNENEGQLSIESGTVIMGRVWCTTYWVGYGAPPTGPMCFTCMYGSRQGVSMPLTKLSAIFCRRSIVTSHVHLCYVCFSQQLLFSLTRLTE